MYNRRLFPTKNKQNVLCKQKSSIGAWYHRICIYEDSISSIHNTGMGIGASLLIRAVSAVNADMDRCVLLLKQQGFN